MESIKIMLLGLALMILPIAINLLLTNGIVTDFIVFVGLFIVVAGFFKKGR